MKQTAKSMLLFKRYALLAVIAVSLAATSGVLPQQASAQTLKLGYANAEALLPYLPAYQDIAQKVQRHVQSSQEVLQVKADQFQADYAQFEKQASLMAADARAEREAQLSQRYAQLQQLGVEKEAEAAEYEQSLITPLLEKVQEAVDAVAKAKGLDIVLRAPSILYVNEETIVDITPDVASRLGLNIDELLSENAGN